MKIIFFTENSYAGGVDSVIIDLINHWPDHNNDELVLICNSSHPGLEVIARHVHRPLAIVAHNILLHWQWMEKINRLPLPSIVKKVISTLSRYPFFLYWQRAAKALLIEQKADRLLVVNGGYPAGDSCRSAASVWPKVAPEKPPCVFNFHNLAIRARWWERWAENAIDRLLVRSVKSFIAVSGACANSMDNRPAIAASGKVSFILNGIKKPKIISAQTTSDLRKELSVAENTPLCLMLGTYEPRKGHAYLLEAFSIVLKSHPSARLVICGYGYEDDIQRVKTLVREKGIENQVRLHGFREDATALIEAADVQLVSSQAFESFGLTIVEAMAHSTPVVATNVGGIPEVIGKNVGGYCVSVNDAYEFAHCVASLLADRSLREQVGHAGYERYRILFTAERMAQEYATLVRSCE
jgi:L-malate glycosyltransferase